MNDNSPKLTPANNPTPKPHRKPTMQMGMVEPRVIDPPKGALYMVNPDKTSPAATSKAPST